MAEILGPMCTVFVMMGVFVAIVMFMIYSHKRTQERWALVAQMLGLEHKPGGFFDKGCVEGTYKGYWARVDTFTRGSGKNSKTYTRVQLLFNPVLGLGFRIGREGFFTGLGKMFGSQDIETGDEAFDGRFLIKGDDLEQVVRFLNAELRQQMMRYDSDVGSLDVNDARVYYETRGVLTDGVEIQRLLEHQVALAGVVVRASAEVAARQVAHVGVT